MKVLIVDDERNNRILLRKMLGSHEDIQLIWEASNAMEAMKLINTNHPDLVLLDVEMPGGTGFDLLESIPQRDFHVIFITAYEKYAIKAIKQKAFDYLLKPIDPVEFNSIIIQLTGANSAPPNDTEVKDKLVINTQEETYFVKISDIVQVSGGGNYCVYHLASGKTVAASYILKKAQDDLPSDIFFRVHNSHLVNIEHVQKIDKMAGDAIILSDGSNVPLSRRRKEEFLKVLME
jgi:two-component system LytT family response regulator